MGYRLIGLENERGIECHATLGTQLNETSLCAQEGSDVLTRSSEKATRFGVYRSQAGSLWNRCGGDRDIDIAVGEAWKWLDDRFTSVLRIDMTDSQRRLLST